MTLDELNRIDTGSPEQVKALQNFLKSRGYYNGAIDGKWGGGTVDGVKALRGDLQSEATTKLKTAEATRDTEQARSSWGRIAQEVGPYVGGAAGGAGIGYGLMRATTRKDKALAEDIGRMAENKRVNPAVAEKTLDARMGARRIRTGAQFLAPGLAFGAAEFTRDFIKPRVDPESQRYVDLAANMEQGVGVGLTGMLAKDAIFRGNPVPADTEALIRSRAAEARGDPYTISSKEKATTTAPKAPDPARMAELRAKRAVDLRADAKAMGLHVSGTKDDLVRRIADAGQKTATKAGKLGNKAILPLAVGYSVYDALANPAEAGNADVAEYASTRLSQGDTLAKMEDVYSDYAKFARARGQTPIPERAFMRQLTDQGIGAARIGGANRVTASINPGEYVAKAAEAPSRATAAAAGTAAAGGTYGAGKLAGYAIDAVRNTPLGRFAARAVPAAGAALTAYDIGNMAAEENARPDTMLHGPEEGTMPATPGNPQFMARQQTLARQTRGGDDFDAQLAAFIQAVEEHNAGAGEPYGP